MKNSVLRSVSFLLPLLILFSCEFVKPEVKQEDSQMKTKLNYAFYMCFETTVGLSSYTIFNALEDKEAGYTEVAFVPSEDEVSNYDDSVIVCWPCDLTEDVLTNLNSHIQFQKVNTAPFGLEYPIMLDDAVGNWESVSQLLDSLSAGARANIYKPYSTERHFYSDREPKDYYAIYMRFQWIEGDYQPYIRPHNPEEIKNFIFVISNEEATNFQDHILAGWPSEYTKTIISGLNTYIQDNRIDLEPFYLEYPVTISDAVERWEFVDNLLKSFGPLQKWVLTNPN